MITQNSKKKTMIQTILFVCQNITEMVSLEKVYNSCENLSDIFPLEFLVTKLKNCLLFALECKSEKIKYC